MPLSRRIQEGNFRLHIATRSPAHGNVGGMHNESAPELVTQRVVSAILPKLAADVRHEAAPKAKSGGRPRFLRCPLCGNVSNKVGFRDSDGTCLKVRACEARR